MTNEADPMSKIPINLSKNEITGEIRNSLKFELYAAKHCAQVVEQEDCSNSEYILY